MSSSPQHSDAPEVKLIKQDAKTSDLDTEQASDPKTLEDKGEIDGEKEGGGEEEGECPFCLYMKGGGCKESFTAWENCIEEAEEKNEDIVEKCFKVTGALMKCMEEHEDYYEPIIRADKKAKEEAVNELQREKQPETSSSSAGLEDHQVDSKNTE